MRITCVKCGKKPDKKDKPRIWARPSRGNKTINICPECHERFMYAIALFRGRSAGQ